jgi:hypothetical protein
VEQAVLHAVHDHQHEGHERQQQNGDNNHDIPSTERLEVRVLAVARLMTAASVTNR